NKPEHGVAAAALDEDACHRLIGNRHVPPSRLLLKQIRHPALDVQMSAIFPTQDDPGLVIAEEDTALDNRPGGGDGERARTLPEIDVGDEIRGRSAVTHESSGGVSLIG